jgi:hypothetical protein
MGELKQASCSACSLVKTTHAPHQPGRCFLQSQHTVALVAVVPLCQVALTCSAGSALSSSDWTCVLMALASVASLAILVASALTCRSCSSAARLSCTICTSSSSQSALAWATTTCLASATACMAVTCVAKGMGKRVREWAAACFGGVPGALNGMQPSSSQLVNYVRVHKSALP